MTSSSPPSSFREGERAAGNAEGEEPDDAYEPPVVIDLGPVREVTLGSSSSGTADANSQYYW
ncbi:lasso RiPP family leader peptide-containing protein [Streptomyces sp. BP-8]|uniref:Lasso RiPP family leader peptide-containing protein n=1 Tax=Streptomyces sirii TaxID=3127701 RepID=A0ABZ2QFJ8_9ACTN